MPRKFVVYYGPGYVAYLVPVPQGKEPQRSDEDSNRVSNSDPFPDFNAYLVSKKSGIADWARKEFDPAIAAHMVRFLRTGSLRDLSTLTEREVKLLREKIEEVRRSVSNVKTPNSE